jgi:hypothetical protein
MVEINVLVRVWVGGIVDGSYGFEQLELPVFAGARDSVPGIICLTTALPTIGCLGEER